MAILQKSSGPSAPRKSSVPTARKTAPRVTKKAQETASGKTAMDLPIFSMEGKKVSSIAAPTELFGAPWRADLVHQVATGMQANARQNRAHTKDRSEVSGGGKKPWKQKGTGQARHGSTRSPVWRHGGITFGPRNTRDYSEKINRKMRAGALAAILSKKMKEGEIILVDNIRFIAPKTKDAKAMLVALEKGAKADILTKKTKNAALIVTGANNQMTQKSFSNIGSVLVEEVRNVNVVDLLAHKYLIIENPKESFDMLLSRVTRPEAARSKMKN